MRYVFFFKEHGIHGINMYIYCMLCVCIYSYNMYKHIYIYMYSFWSIKYVYMIIYIYMYFVWSIKNLYIRMQNFYSGNLVFSYVFTCFWASQAGSQHQLQAWCDKSQPVKPPDEVVLGMFFRLQNNLSGGVWMSRGTHILLTLHILFCYCYYYNFRVESTRFFFKTCFVFIKNSMGPYQRSPK